MDKLKFDSEKEVSKFVRNFLKRDGMFLVRLVAKNSSDMIAAELLCGLWEHYKENKRIIEKLDSRDDKRHQIRALIRQEEKEAIGSVQDLDTS